MNESSMPRERISFLIFFKERGETENTYREARRIFKRGNKRLLQLHKYRLLLLDGDVRYNSE